MTGPDGRVGRRWAVALGLAGVTAALPAKASMPAVKPDPALHTEVLDVRTFGATGDGVTDDAPAINAALDAMRSQRQGAPSWAPGFRMQLNGGTFRIGSPLNMTSIQHFNVVIDGGGAVLLGATDGSPVVDALGSRWLHFRDLYIFGDKDHPPSIGLQIGRSATGQPADNYILENVSVNGFFSLACLYNFAAETTVFLHCTAWNKNPSANAYCLIQDGLNHFAAGSIFSSDRPAENMAESFNENLLINCDFRSNGAASPLWLASTSRHQFQRCYAAAENAPGCVLHVGGQGHTMLEMDCHFEAPEMQDLFLLTGAAQAQFRGFTYKDHATPPINSVFTTDPTVEAVEMQNACIEIAGYTRPQARLLDNPAIWSASGSYYSHSPHGWTPPARFSGMVTLGLEQTFYGTVIAP